MRIKTKILVWFTLQLCLLTYINIDILNKIENGSYICSTTRYVPPYLGILLPVSVLVPDNEKITNYCNKQRLIK